MVPSHDGHQGDPHRRECLPSYQRPLSSRNVDTDHDPVASIDQDLHPHHPRRSGSVPWACDQFAGNHNSHSAPTRCPRLHRDFQGQVPRETQWPGTSAIPGLLHTQDPNVTTAHKQLQLALLGTSTVHVPRGKFATPRINRRDHNLRGRRYHCRLAPLMGPPLGKGNVAATIPPLCRRVRLEYRQDLG
jgi:hypothetical protein